MNGELSLILLIAAVGVTAIWLNETRGSSRRGKFRPSSRNWSTSQSGNWQKPVSVDAPRGSVDRQLSALRSSKIVPKKPINKTAYRVMVDLERELRTRAPKARVLAEVGMGGFLSTGGGGDLRPEDREAFSAFVAKRVDFLVIDGFGNPAFAVEFQGGGHYLGDTAAGRDAVKKEALRLAGVELVEIQNHASAEERRALIAGAIRRNCMSSGGAGNEDGAETNADAAG